MTRKALARRIAEVLFNEPATWRGAGDRGRDKVGLCPSLRTGLANLLHPALQLAVTFEKISRRILLNFKVRSVVVSRYRGG